jgi:hypothetical protein
MRAPVFISVSGVATSYAAKFITISRLSASLEARDGHR